MPLIFGTVSLVIITASVNLLYNAILIYFFWNYCVPDLFGLPEINLFQAFSLYVLSRVLFNKYSNDFLKLGSSN